MSFKIFYSWQSDTPKTENMNFIQDCLRDAIKKLKTKFKQDEQEFYLDRDTKGTPGYPNIPETISKKIGMCDVFIGDLTFVIASKTKKYSSNNVTTELGSALSEISEERVIVVMNTAYGTPDELPFDISQRRFPITYHLPETATKEERLKVAQDLSANLYTALKLVFETEQERQKKEMHPFDTWNTWDKEFSQRFKFEKTEYTEEIFNSIREQLKSPSPIVRLLGLSGLGKTNLVLEYFRSAGEDSDAANTSMVLYANMNNCDQREVLAKAKELFRKGENKVIILDNCPMDFHQEMQKLIDNKDSKLRLITISPEPDEQKQEIDISGKTLVIKLDSVKFKPVVRALLEKNFQELSPEDRELIVEYSNGLPFFAVLMADNPEATRVKPGTLTTSNILQKILGTFYTDPEKKKILMACAIFARFGVRDEYEDQQKGIALSRELCDIEENDDELRVRKFQKTCREMMERQLLENSGFSVVFRPTPLALRLAEEWWENCTTAKFLEIIKVLEEYKLVESFCQQFRYLTHVQYAKEIVGKLCEGVFSTAGVLNTEVGSRLFRSFVNVNPTACALALDRAFGHMTKEELLEIKSGRRNLVWALEQLCFRAEAFEKSIFTLAAFATAENENISNNSRQQFLQLFHIRLPGTEVNLEKRWNVIATLLEIDRDYRDLAISAASRALKTDNFRRSVGAEEEYSQHPKDYQPSAKEITDYWTNAINLLFQEAVADGPDSEDAKDTLLQRLYGICENGLGKLVIPKIEKLYDLGKLDWRVIRPKIQLIIGHNRIYDLEAIGELKRLLAKITPDNFDANFEMFVRNPTSEDYFRTKTEDGKKDFIPKKVVEVATQFASDKNGWENAIPQFVSGHIAEGLLFGNTIGKLITSEEEVELFLDLFLVNLKKENAQQKNLSVLFGFLLSGEEKKSIAQQVYDRIYADEELYPLAIHLAQRIELPYQKLERLIEDIKIGKLRSVDFLNFKYGWGFMHLPEGQFYTLMDSLSNADSHGKAVAFVLCYTWSYNDPEKWQMLSGLLKHLIKIASIEIIQFEFENSIEYYWSETVNKLLKGTNDNDFASYISYLVIEICNKGEGFYRIDNELHQLIKLLLEEYFDVFWETIKTVFDNPIAYDSAIFYLTTVIQARFDYSRQTVGLLFGVDEPRVNLVMDWLKAQPVNTALYFARIIPIHNLNTGAKTFDPIALELIDVFGDSNKFLDEISAKLGSYSWVGSVVHKLEDEMQMFKSILDHKNANVRTWAKSQISSIERRIDWERSMEEERFGKWRG